MNRDAYSFNDALPGDPKLDALLDEALSPQALPGGLPAGLTDRIVARTAPIIARRQSVIARIGVLRIASMAAMLLVGVTIALIVFQNPGAPAKPGIELVIAPPTHSVAADVTAVLSAETVADALLPSSLVSVDGRISEIDQTLTRTGDAKANWDSLTSTLEQALDDMDADNRG